MLTATAVHTEGIPNQMNTIPTPRVLVSQLFKRPLKGAPPEETGELTLQTGIGIKNDCHAHPLSPRQVLIVSIDSYADFHLFEPGSLRENILFAPNISFKGQDLKSGDVLSIANGLAELRITFKCEPCGKLNNLIPNLSRTIKGKRGYLARVVSDGIIKRGDTFNLTKGVYPPFSDDWRERVAAIGRLLPPDRFLSYAKLALLAGVPKTYCRVFPKVLRSNNLLNRHVVSSSDIPVTEQEWGGFEVFSPEPSYTKDSLAGT